MSQSGERAVFTATQMLERGTHPTGGQSCEGVSRVTTKRGKNSAMTDNHGAKPRASTRSARASQERKEILEAAQALPLAPEAAAASAHASNAKAAPADATADNGSVSDEAESARRSSRRAANKALQSATAGGSPAKSDESNLDAAAGEKTKTPTTDVITEFVTNGGSLAAAAGRFGLSRAEVTKIVKDSTVQSGTASTSSVAIDESKQVASDTVSDLDATTGSGKREVPTELDTLKGTKNPQVTQFDASKTPEAVAAIHQSLQVPPLGVDHSLSTSMPVANELKRTADALTDAGSDTGGASSGSVVPKAKRVRKTREEKLAILAFVDDGGTHVAAAEKFGVSRTAVTKMVKEREIIMSGMTGKHHTVVNTPVPTATVPGSSFVEAASAAGVIALSNDTAPIPTTRKTRAATASAATSSSNARSQHGADNTTNPKAKRVRKTNEEKLMILEFVERGGSQGAAAEKFGVSRTAVTKMVKEREAITAQVMSGKSNHRKVLQYQHKLSIIEDMLYKWQVQVENDAPNLKITGDLLQSKAVEFRDKILAEWKGSLEPEVVQSLSDFKASNGWLHRYLQRRNLRTASKREYHRRSGPNSGGTVPASPSEPLNLNIFVADVTQRLRAVPVQCIWNMDEVALLPKALSAPDVKDIGTDGIDRMTVALMVNAAGEKFKPQVLIPETYVEAAEALQKSQPNVFISAQQNAWQDTTALALYLHTVSSEAKQRLETWYIVMDASPSHVEFAQLVDPAGSFEQGYRFENLVLYLLPPQATQDHQPLHHGVSRVFKAAFRQAMLTAVVQKWMDTVVSGAGADNQCGLLDKIQASEEIAWVSQAWDAVPSPLIRHCWVRNGLLSSPQLAQISQDNSRAVEAELFRSLTDTLSSMNERNGGALSQALGLPGNTSTDAITPSSLLDQVNALITLDDNEPTERKVDMNVISTTSQVITETDANGDLRALV